MVHIRHHLLTWPFKANQDLRAERLLRDFTRNSRSIDQERTELQMLTMTSIRSGPDKLPFTKQAIRCIEPVDQALGEMMQTLSTDTARSRGEVIRLRKMEHPNQRRREH